MSSHPVVRTLVLVAAVVGLASWLAIEERARTRLVEEQRTLRQQLAEMSDLAARNRQPANLAPAAHPSATLPDEQLRELLRLRGQVGLLRRQTSELETLREENRKAHASAAPSAASPVATADYWPRDAWAFSGQTSPEAALQTSLWAANNGDLKALAATVTGDVQKMMSADLGGKSEAEASIRAMDEVSSLKSVRVLGREVQSEDTMVITAVFESRTDTHTGKLVMKKEGGSWKVSSMLH